MALPPILNAGTDEMKAVCREVVMGKKHVCLAISEPYAGSDVAGIRTTAKKTEDGKYYVVRCVWCLSCVVLCCVVLRYVLCCCVVLCAHSFSLRFQPPNHTTPHPHHR